VIEDLAPTSGHDPAWLAYIATERQAQAEYNEATNEAQRNFEIDAKPAIDTYHSVERAAWQRYVMTSRAAKRRYLESTTQMAAADTTPPAAPPEFTPHTPYVPAGVQFPPHPTFTPAKDSDQ
jgi:hypothetical protein